MNLQESFKKWYSPRAPQSYRNWNWQRKLGEIVDAYRASFKHNFFEVDLDQRLRAAQLIQDNLAQRAQVPDPTFARFDERASNGIPKAIIGQFIGFLRECSTEVISGLADEAPENPDEEPAPHDDAESAAAGFSYEADLKRALAEQVEELFPGYAIYGGNKEGIEYFINGKRIDLLLQQKEGDGLVAIELKAGRADFKVFGQISMYLGLLMDRFPERKLQGIIIAGEIDASLASAARTNAQVSLMSYRMTLSLRMEPEMNRTGIFAMKADGPA